MQNKNNYINICKIWGSPINAGIQTEKYVNNNNKSVERMFYFMDTNCLHPRGGWSPEETDMLFTEIEAASADGASIKSAFDKVAAATGRKPNSIRNYYYLKIRETGDLSHAAFVPFAREEVHSLMRTMLTRQADGQSVRGIAMELGNGDKKAMLRYQNKYRSVLRTDPEYVRSLMAELQEEGSAYVDPFCRKGKMRDAGAILSELADQLNRTGMDTDAFFRGLLLLARSAAEKTPDPRMQELLRELSLAKRENMDLRERCGALCAVNASFLEKDGLERIAGLNEYCSELRRILTPTA